MKITTVENDDVECVITKRELLMIKNCLGEVCFGMNFSEFQTRIGFSQDDVGNFVKELKALASELGIEE